MGAMMGIQSKLQPITVLLIFLIIVINQIFLISLATVLLKKIKLIIRSTARKYYSFVIFYIVSKMILCVILQVKILQGIPQQFEDLDSKNIEILFKNSLVFADCAIVQLFLIAFEHYIALSFSIFGNFRIQKTVRILMQGVQLVTFFTLMIPLLIFNTGSMSYQTLNVFMSGINCFNIIAFIAAFFFMNFKMTGIMMNRRSSQIIKKVYTLLLATLLSRTIMAVLEIWIEINLKSGSFQDFISIIQENQDQYVVLGSCFIFYILIIFLTEGLPLMLSLREALIMALTQERRTRRTGGTSSIITEQSIREQLLNNFDDQEVPQQSPQHSINRGSYENKSQSKLNAIQNISNLTILQKLSASEDYSTYKTIGKQNNQIYFLRELVNISSYIIEEIVQELQFFQKSNVACVNFTKTFQDNESGRQKFFILESYQEESLDKKLQSSLKNASLKQKITLSLDIAKAIQQFHQCFKIGHGVITPRNILFDKDNRVKLTGFGMESLKKYLSLTADYTNITYYTDVDLMGTNRQKTISKAKKSADIYSFGIILYEILALNLKYRQLSISQVRENFKKEGFRPKISENIDESLKRIMRKCWQGQTEVRPDISWVVTNLEEFKSHL